MSRVRNISQSPNNVEDWVLSIFELFRYYQNQVDLQHQPAYLLNILPSINQFIKYSSNIIQYNLHNNYLLNYYQTITKLLLNYYQTITKLFTKLFIKLQSHLQYHLIYNFNINQNQIIHTMTDDPRLSSLINQGKHGQIVIIGYPFEHAALRMRRKGGEENGPCCLRRFYPKVGPLINSQYQIDISNIKLTDYGNIHGDTKKPKQLETSLKSLLHQLISQNKIPIVFGGSRQTTNASSNTFIQLSPKGKLLFFCGYPSVSRPYDHDKLSSNSLFQILPETSKDQYLLIGTDDRYWPAGCKIQLNRIDIREIRKVKTQIREDVFRARTQMGTLLQDLLQKQQAKDIYVSFSLEVIKHFMGTYYKTFQGLQQQEIFEVMLQLGMDGRVRCIDITEFNPSNEDYNSSLTILNMVYYFLLGYQRRKNLS